MSEFTPLREAVDTLAYRALPPDFGDLTRRATRRGRRRVALGVAAGAAVVVTVGIAGAALSGGERTLPPVQQPSPTETESPSTSEEWTPERIRAEGSPLGAVFDYRLGPAPSGLDAELYCIGGQGCDDFPPDLEGRTSHFALEMTQGGQSVLFDVQGRPWAKYFGEDSILIQDGTDQAVRFRRLQADGTAVQLRLVSDLAPAVPGPDVMLIQALEGARDFQVGPEGPGIQPYLVEARAATLQLLDVPMGIEWWGPNVDEFLWGGNDCRVIWQRPDGSFDHHDFDCRDHGAAAPTDPGWNFVGFEDWAEPGRLALVEHNSDGLPLVAHVSLDYGATWQTIPVEHTDPDHLASWTLVTSQIR